jgi:hypothetical protein
VSEPVFVLDASRWPRMLARLRQLGELDEDDARADLRYLENEHRVWMLTGGKRGASFPGRRVLAERWGWTERRARYLLEADDWHDPLNPVSAKDLRAKFERPASVPLSVPPLSRGCPATQQANADNPQEASRERPADVPLSVPQVSIACVSLNHDQPRNHTQTAAEPAETAAAVPDVSGLWGALVAFTPKPDGWKLTEPRRKAIRARIKDHDLATVERVFAWVNTSTHERASFLRERGDPDTVLRRGNFDKYAGMSMATGPPGSGGSGPASTPVRRPSVWDQLDEPEPSWPH